MEMWDDILQFIRMGMYVAALLALWFLILSGPRRVITSIATLVGRFWRRLANVFAARTLRLEQEGIDQFRAKHPAKIIGVPDPEAVKSTVDDFEFFTAAANACRPTFSRTDDPKRWPVAISCPFSLARECQGSEDGPDPEPWTITLESLKIDRGQDLRAIYQAVLSAEMFPHSLPELKYEPSTPDFPRRELPKWEMRIVFADGGGEIDFRVPELRKTYAKELVQVAKFKEMGQQFRDLIGNAEEAKELMDIHIAKERLAFNETKAGLIRDFNWQKQRYDQHFDQELGPIKKIYKDYTARTKEAIESHFQFSLRALAIPVPPNFPWSTFYDPSERVLQINQRVPSISDVIVKRVDSKRAPAKREVEYMLRRIVPAVSLHMAQQVGMNDLFDDVDSIAVNCWCRFFDRATGRLRNAFVSSLSVNKEDIVEININKADALDAFRALRGAYVYNTEEAVPIDPQIRLDKKDDRFVEGKEVLEGMAQGQNLATMDWQDVEHLIRELFAKEFGRKEGSEVRITRASRDRGVDAVVFDPDPLHGGKYVVQAKRYNNLVDVSAVRDLWGTVLNEGAARGILVTTSRYGRDAYDFASNKPLALIDGQNLLALLAKHGFKFKIELA
jgi:hypothetical protein